MTVYSDSAVNMRPVTCDQYTSDSLVSSGDNKHCSIDKWRRTSSMRSMLLYLSDQLRHSIPIPFTACLVQPLDVLGCL